MPEITISNVIFTIKDNPNKDSPDFDDFIDYCRQCKKPSVFSYYDGIYNCVKCGYDL